MQMFSSLISHILKSKIRTQQGADCIKIGFKHFTEYKLNYF